MGMEYRNKNVVAQRAKKKARGVTRAGPVVVKSMTDGTVLRTERGLTKNEVHAILDRTNKKPKGRGLR